MADDLHRTVRIMGIDPGLRVTGYGVIALTSNRLSLVEAGVVRSHAEAPLSERLDALYLGMGEAMDDLSPDVIAVEELYSHYGHPRTAILMGHARGVVLLAAARRGLPLTSYAPTAVKRALTGSGQAGKEMVQRAIRERLGLSIVPQPADVADALAVAVCHAQRTLLRASSRAAVVSP